MDLAWLRPYRVRARPAEALSYHLSRRSRAHDRCSVGERGWEGGGRCTLSQGARYEERKGGQRGQGEGRQNERNGKREKAVSSVRRRLAHRSPVTPRRCVPPVHRVLRERLTIALAWSTLDWPITLVTKKSDKQRIGRSRVGVNIISLCFKFNPVSLSVILLGQDNNFHNIHNHILLW